MSIDLHSSKPCFSVEFVDTYSIHSFPPPSRRAQQIQPFPQSGARVSPLKPVLPILFTFDFKPKTTHFRLKIAPFQPHFTNLLPPILHTAKDVSATRFHLHQTKGLTLGAMKRYPTYNFDTHQHNCPKSAHFRRIAATTAVSLSKHTQK